MRGINRSYGTTAKARPARSREEESTEKFVEQWASDNRPAQLLAKTLHDLEREYNQSFRRLHEYEKKQAQKGEEAGQGEEAEELKLQVEQSKFALGWALLRAQEPEQKQRAKQIFTELYTHTEIRKRLQQTSEETHVSSPRSPRVEPSSGDLELLYCLALSHYRLNELEPSLEYVNHILSIQSTHRQAEALKTLIKQNITAKTKRYLVFIDSTFSEACQAALHRAAELMTPRDIICLFSILPPQEHLVDQSFVGWKSLVQERTDELLEALQRKAFYYLNDKNLSFYSLSGSGKLEEALCTVVEAQGIDILVLPLSPQKKNLFGIVETPSISDYCVNNARCDVLVVKANTQSGTRSA